MWPVDAQRLHGNRGRSARVRRSLGLLHAGQRGDESKRPSQPQDSATRHHVFLAVAVRVAKFTVFLLAGRHGPLWRLSWHRNKDKKPP